jgi:hypothetical protein
MRVLKKGWKVILMGVMVIFMVSAPLVFGGSETYPQPVTQFEFSTLSGKLIVTVDDFKEMSTKDLERFVTFLILNKSTRPTPEIIGIWGQKLIPDLLERVEKANKEK